MPKLKPTFVFENYGEDSNVLEALVSDAINAGWPSHIPASWRECLDDDCPISPDILEGVPVERFLDFIDQVIFAFPVSVDGQEAMRFARLMQISIVYHDAQDEDFSFVIHAKLNVLRVLLQKAWPGQSPADKIISLRDHMFALFGIPERWDCLAQGLQESYQLRKEADKFATSPAMH